MDMTEKVTLPTPPLKLSQWTSHLKNLGYPLDPDEEPLLTMKEVNLLLKRHFCPPLKMKEFVAALYSDHMTMDDYLGIYVCGEAHSIFKFTTVQMFTLHLALTVPCFSTRGGPIKTISPMSVVRKQEYSHLIGVHTEFKTKWSWLGRTKAITSHQLKGSHTGPAYLIDVVEILTPLMSTLPKRNSIV